MNQFEHPMFRPLWVRILIVLICAGWGGVEFFNGTYFWCALFWGVGAYSAYRFFITFNPESRPDKEDQP